MSTKRHGEEENIESFQKEKNKVKFEETIDRNRVKVEEKKNEKYLKKDSKE